MTSTRRFMALTAVVIALTWVRAPVAYGAVSTVSEYRDRVIRAAEVVQAGEDAVADRSRAIALAKTLRELLPAREQVRDETRTIAVSDPALTSLASELESATSGGERTDVVRRMKRHLDTLRGSMGAPGTQARSDPAALRRLLAEVRTGPVVPKSTLLQDVIDRVLRAIEAWLARVSATPQGAMRLRAVWYAVLALFAGLACFVVWRGVRAWRRAVVRRDRPGVAGSGSPVIEAAEGLPQDAGAFADTLAREGRYREALRALFGGAARTLGERGVLARTRSRTRTNAELLAEVGAAAPAVEVPLRGLSDAFEVAWYGHREPGERGFTSARALYDATLRAHASPDVEGGEGA
jgi:hypothetical protein